VQIDSSEDPGICQCRRMPSWLGGNLEFRHTGRTPRWQRPAYAGPPCKTAPYTVIVPIYPADPSFRCTPMDPACGHEPDPSHGLEPVSEHNDLNDDASR
jgi:hypothetical protein